MSDDLESPREEPQWVENEPTPQPTGQRLPPHDLNAEMSLLGAALMDVDAAAIAAAVPGDAWYAPAHGLIADAIADLAEKGEHVDPVTVWDQVKRMGMADQIGSTDTLVRIMTSAPGTTGVKRYRKIILEHHKARSLLAAAGEVAYAAHDGDVTTALGHLEKALDSVGTTDGGAKSIHDVAVRHLELVEARQSGQIRSVKTGLRDFDRLVGGFRPGALWIVAGRPGMGKSGLAGQFSLNVAQAGTRVLFVTIEMSEDELMDRLAANVGQVPHEHIRDGTMTVDEYDRYAAAISKVAAWPIHILDEGEVSIAQVRAECRATKAEMVIVDYLTLMQAPGKHGNRQEEVASLARGLKIMARTLDIPVIALAQLHRGVETRTEKRPVLADLRESGELEQAADGVLMLYRDEYYNPDSADKGLLELGVQKHRHGAKGLVVSAYLPQFQMVADAAHEKNRSVA